MSQVIAQVIAQGAPGNRSEASMFNSLNPSGFPQIINNEIIKRLPGQSGKEKLILAYPN